MYKKMLLVLLAGLFIAPNTMADRRKYVWTYQTVTTPKGMSELEFYQTTRLNDIDKWEYRIEVEQGITNNWDFSVYQIFTQTDGESLKWDAFQLRSRYRLGEPGQYFLDPILYMEYRRKTKHSQQNKAEVKLLLGKDFDKVNFSVNPVYEYFWGGHNEGKQELGVDMALSYSPNFSFSIGIESTTRHEILEFSDNETGSYLGPTVSFATGHTFYSVGYAWGVTDESDDARVRFLMGVGL